MTRAADRPLLTGGLPAPVTAFRRARGGEIEDEGGQTFLDLVSGYGAVILGHGDPDVADAVAAVARSGQYLYGRHRDVDALKGRLLARFPAMSQALLFKTGSEAVQAAVRMARAATGRPRILRCGFHGWHDQFMANDISWHRLEVDVTHSARVPGVPIASSLITAVAGDARAGWLPDVPTDDVAALILDPVQLVEPIAETFAAVAARCRAAHILLIVDEAKTGFRLSSAGAQGLYNIFGDITILSKAIANGFPLAAVLTRPEIDVVPTDAKIMGTFNNELSAVAAALVTLRKLDERDAPRVLRDAGADLITVVNQSIAAAGAAHLLQLVPYRWPSMPYFSWSAAASQDLKLAFNDWLARHRVLWLANHMNFVNLAHSHSQFVHFAGAVGTFFKQQGSVS